MLLLSHEWSRAAHDCAWLCKHAPAHYVVRLLKSCQHGCGSRLTCVLHCTVSSCRSRVGACCAEGVHTYAGSETGIRPDEIDILVTNCSIYCPTPSLASMLVNKFKMRQDVQSYHLGGMGCGNGVMALGLIKDLLQVNR